MHMRTRLVLLWILLATFCGCSSSTSIDQEDEIAESDETFVLGDLLTPFDPPSLEQLEQTVAAGGGWVERPVLDGLKLLRARQAQEPVLATVDEAIALWNNSKEENTKILSALGRLPKNDNDVDYSAQITRATPQALNKQNPLLASSTTEFEVSSLTGFGLFGFSLLGIIVYFIELGEDGAGFDAWVLILSLIGFIGSIVALTFFIRWLVKKPEVA